MTKESSVTAWKLWAVFFVQLNEGYQINVLFPFVVFMIRELNDNISENQIGFYAGILTASFCIAQFLCCSFWGWISDLYGRRITLLIGFLFYFILFFFFLLAFFLFTRLFFLSFFSVFPVFFFAKGTLKVQPPNTHIHTHTCIPTKHTLRKQKKKPKRFIIFSNCKCMFWNVKIFLSSNACTNCWRFIQWQYWRT